MNSLRIAFGWSGRIDRPTFLSMFGLASAVGAAFSIMNAAVAFQSPKLALALTALYFPVSAWSALAINVKRLRDMGRSPTIAFIPIATFAASGLLLFHSVAAAAALRSEKTLIMGAVGFAALLCIACLVSVGVMIWLFFAASSPNGSGERLTLFGDMSRDARDAGPSVGLASAMEEAISRRRSTNAAPAYAPAMTRPSGLPRRPPGDGFGRRR